MKFCIITHAYHKIDKDKVYSYEPYVREMNLWLQNVSHTKIVAPFSTDKPTAIDSCYFSTEITTEEIPHVNLLNIKNKILALLNTPYIFYKIIKTFIWADHIHLRCPGNIGLLGCIVQIFFPRKVKTVKYAGNWDPNSKQPFSYKLQKWILSNTFLTKNCKVLVYGEWKNQSQNIVPFFTASYFKNEIENLKEKKLEDKIKLLFVGGLTVGKQPMLSVKSVHELINKGINVELNVFGEGVKRIEIENYIKEHNLSTKIILHGNCKKEVIKKAFKDSHFLIFISKSEGWPKVVAEAMFWSCLPISSRVSCIPQMLNFGKRGSVINGNMEEVTHEIIYYLKNENVYKIKVENAKIWSQKFTLDKFSDEIKIYILNE